MKRAPVPFAPPWRGWLLLVIALCSIAAIAATDRRMKSAEGPGFAPAEAQWILYTPSLPRVWLWLQNAPEWDTLRDAFPSNLLDPALEIRKATGIRPTPTRWQHWLGQSWLLFRMDGVWGASVRPGILLHAAHVVLGTPVPGSDQLYSWNNYYYGWREGYLLFSADQDTAAAALAAPPFFQETPNSVSPFVEVHFRRGISGHLTFYGAPGVPIAGALASRIAPAERNLQPRYAWDDPPLAFAMGGSIEQLDQLRQIVQGALQHLDPEMKILRGLPPLAGHIYDAWSESVEGARPGAVSVALHDMAWYGTVPVPIVAALWEIPNSMSNASLLTPALPLAQSQPYRWQDTEGAVTPLWGDGAAFCRAGTAQTWLATSNVSLMGDLLSGMGNSATTQGSLYTSIFWPKLIRGLSTALARAGDAGLLTQWLEQEGIQSLDAFLVALESLSTMNLTLDGRDGRTAIQGYLNLPTASRQTGATFP